MAYSFRKMFFIGENLKHVYMAYYFLEFLIFFWLTLVVYFSPHQRNFVYKYKLQWKPILNNRNKNKEKYIFTSLWYWYWKINIGEILILYIPYQQFLIFLIFMNTFSDVAVCRCFSKLMLLKISQYSELQRDSTTGVFL